MASMFGCVQLFVTLQTVPPALQFLCPWNFPSKNTGVGGHFLFQGIFPPQGLNPRLLRLLHWQGNFFFYCWRHLRSIEQHLSNKGNLKKIIILHFSPLQQLTKLQHLQKWQRIPPSEVYLNSNSILKKGLPRGLSGKESTCQCRRRGFDPWMRGRSPGEGNGNPLQYSCLGNHMDRRAWQDTVHGVAKESDMTQQLNNNIEEIRESLF